MKRKAEIAQQLKPLISDPAFMLLKDMVMRKRDRVVNALSRGLLSGVPVDQRKLDYERGFWDGAASVLNRPDNAQDEFDRALKRLEEGTDDE